MAVPILLSPTAADSSTVKAGVDASTTNSAATTPAHHASVISEDGVFWMSLSSDERYLLPKLDALMEELLLMGTDDSRRPKIKSFRISNTQDISNLTSNRPLYKLKQVFEVLAARQSIAGNKHRVELFIKMSLQTESFQNLLESALESGAFSRLVVKGDYWTVAMEPKTMECICRSLLVQHNNKVFSQVQLVGMYMPTKATETLKECLQLQQSGGGKVPSNGISLQFCRIHFEDFAPLVEGIKSDDCTSTLPIQSLSIVECHWDDAKLTPVVEALASRLDANSSSLTRLSLAGNAVGAKTLQAIAAYLHHPHCKLQHLNLSQQTTADMADLICMEDDDNTTFLKALSANLSLKSLHVTDLCLLGRHLGSILNHINWSNGNDSRLEELNLSGNVVESIAEVWHASPKQQRNTFLKRLDLSGNPFWKSTTSAKTPSPERDVLSDMTHCFPHLFCLGKEVARGADMESREDVSSTANSSRYWTQLQYNLDMNRAGRCLFTASAATLPLSLVPVALERANNVLIAPANDKGSDPTAMPEYGDAPSGQFASNPFGANGCQRRCSSPATVRVTSRSASAVYGMIQGLIAEHMGGGL